MLPVFTFFLQIAQSQNRVYLNAGSLLLNIGDQDFYDTAGIIQKNK